MIKRIIKKMIQRTRQKKLWSCGKNVTLGKGVYSGHIEIGSNVSIGKGAWLVSTGAKLIIHDYNVFGPNVTIYTGDHATDVLGKHICEITDEDKRKIGKPYDQDVVIESGCWIGTRAIILKGVRIGRGSVVGAGAIVTKDVPPYTVYVGVPPHARTMKRFSESEINQHEQILKESGLPIC